MMTKLKSLKKLNYSLSLRAYTAHIFLKICIIIFASTKFESFLHVKQTRTNAGTLIIIINRWTLDYLSVKNLFWNLTAPTSDI